MAPFPENPYEAALGCCCPVLFFHAGFTSAQATSYSPTIDFRDDNPWSGANHQTSFSGSQSGIGLTAIPTPSPATLWWDDRDGLGIRHSYEDDEIESDEILRVVFDRVVLLAAIYLSDLFVEEGDDDEYAEKGSYSINGGAWVHFDAESLPGNNRGNGERRISFGTPIDDVRTVEFTAPGRIGHQNHEFALMGFDAEINPVPEPSTALLLSLGLLMVGARARLG
jgi:hypothetical protein